MNSQKIVRNRVLLAGVALILAPALLIATMMQCPAFSSFTKDAAFVLASFNFDGGTAALPPSSSASDITAVAAIGNLFSTPRLDETITISNDTLWNLELAPEEIQEPLDVSQLPYVIPSGSDDLPYPVSLENKSGIIKEVTYTNYTGSQFFELNRGGTVRNCTDISNEVLYAQSQVSPEFKIAVNSAEPQVLIMHTHTTESYEPYSRDFFDASFSSRTTDNTKNVVAVGEAIAQELRSAGIPVIHDTTVHDYPNYNGAYDRSLVTVNDYLAKYPSIKVVIDVHRDAISPADGVRNAPIAEINGRQAAQVMIISGNKNVPEYMKNFSLACLFQESMESNYPGLTRPLLFDYRNYNQELTTGSLLFEMGSHGNSIEQAMYSGELVGKALAEVLLKLT